jgi:hypothetical protein
MKRSLGDLLASLHGDLVHAHEAWEQDVLPHLVDACRRDVHEDTGALGRWQAWLASDGGAVIGQLAGPRAAHQLDALGHVLAAAQLVASEGRWSADDSEHLLGRLPAEIVAAYPRPFLRDLLRQLGGRPAIPIATARVLFPLVLSSGGAVLAQFRVDLLSGTGEVFLDPRQAVSHELHPVFAATVDQARGLARSLLGDGARSGDVRIAIEPHDPAKGVHLQRCLLEGPSAGGALALGLWSLWQGMPLDTGLVVSFALAATSGVTDGRCHEVGGDIEKARGALELKLRTLLLAAEQPGDVDAWGKELGLTVARAATLHEATGIASGLARDLRAYYEALIDKLSETPWKHADGLPVRTEDIAIPVRVLKEQPRETGRRRDREQNDERDRRLPYVDPEVARYYEEPTLERRKELVDWRTEQGNIQRAVVLGAPGGGKSFLAALTAIGLAREGLAALADGRPLDELPVPVHLDLADLAKTLDNQDDPARALVDVLRRSTPRLKDIAWDWIAERARSDRGWLLLDALDQVEHERRPVLHGWLEQVQNQGWRCSALVTCRSANYDRGSLPWRSLAEYELAPFEPGDVRRLVDRWFARDPNRGRLLEGALDRSYPLAHACRSPLVASLVCLVHEERALDDQVRRADLYPRALRLLLKRGWQQRGVVHRESAVDDRLWLLEHLAWNLFPKHPEVNQFPYAEVRKALQEGTRGLGLDLTPTAARDELLDAGILVEAGLDARGESQFSFLHRSFLEYLAGRALARRANGEGWQSIADLVDKKAWHPAWHEVILFLAGQLHDPAPLLDTLADEAKDDFFRHRLALVAELISELNTSGAATDITTDLWKVWFRAANLRGSNGLPHLNRALGAIDVPSLWDAVKQNLTDADASCRERAALGLALLASRTQRRHEAMKLLLPALSGEQEGDVRYQIIEALLEYVRRDPTLAVTHPTLHDVWLGLLDDQEPTTRSDAVEALSLISHQSDSRRIVSTLLARLEGGEEEPLVTRQIARALVSLEATARGNLLDTVTPIILANCFQSWCIDVAGLLYDQGLLVGPQRSELIANLLDQLRYTQSTNDSVDPNTIGNAAHVIARIGGLDSDEVVSALVSMVESKQHLAAARGAILGALGSAAHRPDVRSILLEATKNETGGNVLVALRALSSSSCAGALEPALLASAITRFAEDNEYFYGFTEDFAISADLHVPDGLVPALAEHLLAASDQRHQQNYLYAMMALGAASLLRSDVLDWCVERLESDLTELSLRTSIYSALTQAGKVGARDPALRGSVMRALISCMRREWADYRELPPELKMDHEMTAWAIEAWLVPEWDAHVTTELISVMRLETSDWAVSVMADVVCALGSGEDRAKQLFERLLREYPMDGKGLGVVVRHVHAEGVRAFRLPNRQWQVRGMPELSGRTQNA